MKSVNIVHLSIGAISNGNVNNIVLSVLLSVQCSILETCVLLF